MAKISNRPGTVTAAAVLMFVFGGFSILGSCCGGIVAPLQMALPQPVDANGRKPPDVNRRLNELAPHKLYVDSGFHFLNFLLGIAKIFVGLALWRLASSARVQTIVVAAATIFLTIVYNLYSAILIVPVFDRAMEEELQNAAPMPPGFDIVAKIMQGSMWIGIALGILFTLAIWLTVIFLVSTARARAAFAQGPITALPDDGDIRRSRYDGYDDDDDPPPSARKSPPDTGITDKS